MRVGNLFPCFRGAEVQKDVNSVVAVKVAANGCQVDDASKARKEFEVLEASSESGSLWLQIVAALSGE